MFIVLCIIGTANAQLRLPTSASGQEFSTMHLLAQSFTDFVKAIRPGSFTASFAKERNGFLSSASTIINPADLGKNLSRLTNFLKLSKMKADFNKEDFMKVTLKTTTMEGAKGFLKDLENNLKQGTMTDIWKIQRNGWLSNLNSIQ